MSAHELPAAPRPEGPRPKRPGTPLTPAGVSTDGTRLLLVDDVGLEFTVEIDRRLHDALRDAPRRDPQRTAPLGQLETKMDSTLRPRDIQARIRAGETAEAVAHAAGTSVEKIMAFAAPVLAERAHVAQRAQTSSIRRAPGESAGGARTLGDAVAAQLQSVGVDPESHVEWDSARREDNRWRLSASFTAPDRSGQASFVYDQRGNFVLIENDDARWLVGDAPSEPTGLNDLAAARARRRTAPEGEELPLGEDVLDLVSEADPDTAPTTDLTEAAAALRELAPEQPIEAYLDEPDQPAESATAAKSDEPAAAATDGPAAQDEKADKPEAEAAKESEASPAPPTRRPVRKNRGRASVPSWDEIMFGGKAE